MNTNLIEQDHNVVVGIYHSKDLDGVCCGAIIKLKYPNAILIGYHYGEHLAELPAGVPVIMADVSLPMDQMKAISGESNGMFTWIDHHKSAIEDFKASGSPYIEAVLDTRKSACELTWAHLFPHIKMPVPVELLGIYDTWRQDDPRFDWEKVVMPFQYGMRQIVGLDVEKFPASFLYEPYLEVEDYEDTLYAGQMILDYQKSQNSIIAKYGCFNSTLLLHYDDVTKKSSIRFAKDTKEYADQRLSGRLNAICLNAPIKNSQVFDGLYDPKIHDIMVVWCWAGSGWKFSLYTTNPDVDCSQIAKIMGGGGHQKAAGFEVKSLNEIFPEL